MNDATEVAERARDIIEEAGILALRYFRRPIEVDDKAGPGRFDPVTIADREVESLLRRRLGEAFPDDNLVGEEFGRDERGGDCSWLIDPIDGTRAFISGLPAWGILLGRTQGDRARWGLMHQPYLEETFVGDPEGSRLYRRGDTRMLQTASTSSLAAAILYTTTPEMFHGSRYRAAFERLGRQVRLQRFGGDCYAYCLLAMGHVDLVVESQLQPYDIVPLIPIIEGAGGVVSGPEGAPAVGGGTVIAAANAALHRQALALFQTAS
jgi:myo-inositol-1(or 4)-monophosphatase